MDLHSAESDQQKFAFITLEGLNKFKVMLFCSCNAPATLERMMDNMLRTWKRLASTI